jgi:hypothetical protein
MGFPRSFGCPGGGTHGGMGRQSQSQSPVPSSSRLVDAGRVHSLGNGNGKGGKIENRERTVNGRGQWITCFCGPIIGN